MQRKNLTTSIRLKDRRAPIDIPVIPLRDMAVFPRVTLPVIVRREKSLHALASAMAGDRVVFFVAQKNDAATDPVQNDLHAVGTIARVREVADRKEGGKRILVDGLGRAAIVSTSFSGAHGTARVRLNPEPKTHKTEQIEALMYSTLNQFRRVANMGATVPFDVLLVIMNVSDPWLLGDLIAANIDMKLEEKQSVLEAATVEEKLNRVNRALGRQVKVLQMASKIQAETGKELDKMQREMYLREQMKSIERELDTMSGRGEGDELRERILVAGMPPAVLEKAVKELDRLKAMPSFGPEASYVRTYLECLAEVPWKARDVAAIDLAKAKEILDDAHFGLGKVKERILEYLAVQKLTDRIRGPILCFAGPPGTGKTSVGKAIADAVGRTFVRVSLGGIRDEAEIRGHRRTYVGALPGRIVQGIINAKKMNPVFMLDEIDKLGQDFRGDPSAALLEALDPEQNRVFSDHYLEVPLDLSETLFIATANSLDAIPRALRDRMEVIEFSGYTEREKREIAKRHLLPKMIAESGIAGGFSIDDPAIESVITRYTREAGVRNLGRELASLGRKAARAIAENAKARVDVAAGDLERLLGPAKYLPDQVEEKPQVGVVTGLAWTEAGGEILRIEATAVPGAGLFALTGNLGDIMKESAQAARTYARGFVSGQTKKGVFGKKTDIHVHVPSGAIPKDGPSAGVAITVALVSLMTGTPVKSGIAMTGEITLTGRVLGIGGVKEKVLAAHRYGLKTVILPEENRKDLVDVPAEVQEDLHFIFVRHAEEALKAALSATKKSAR